jgi:hypothetical protein
MLFLYCTDTEHVHEHKRFQITDKNKEHHNTKLNEIRGRLTPVMRHPCQSKRA